MTNHPLCQFNITTACNRLTGAAALEVGPASGRGAISTVRHGGKRVSAITPAIKYDTIRLLHSVLNRDQKTVRFC